MGVAGPAPAAPPHAVPADVGNARECQLLRTGPDRAHRSPDDRHQVGAASGAAPLRVPHVHAASQHRPAPRGRQGADLPRALHPEGCDRGGAELPGTGPTVEDREAGGARRVGRLPFRFPDRQGPAALHHCGHRCAPRRPAAEVPPARREARPGRSAQDHLRDRHPGRRRQRADPVGAVHAAVQVRRHRRAHPVEPGVRADRRAGRAQGIRRPRRRVGPGATARRGEPTKRREGRSVRRQEEGRQAQATRAGLCPLDAGHVRQARRRRARTAAVTLPGQPPDGDEPARPTGGPRRPMAP